MLNLRVKSYLFQIRALRFLQEHYKFTFVELLIKASKDLQSFDHYITVSLSWKIPHLSLKMRQLIVTFMLFNFTN